MFKLIRDNIPAIVEANGGILDYAVVQNDEFFKALLRDKLIEEVNEYLNSNDSLEELADIQLVLNTIIESNKEDFEKIYAAKLTERGGFSKRYLGFFVEPTQNLEQGQN